MKNEFVNQEIIPTVLSYHGKVMATCGKVSEIFPDNGHFLWENFNTFAEKQYFKRKNTCGIIPLISDGREILLCFDTFSPDVAPNMQLFFDESLPSFPFDTETQILLYETLLRGGLSPRVSYDIFLEKYQRMLSVISFFDIGHSSNQIYRINLYELLKKATRLYTSRKSDEIVPDIKITSLSFEKSDILCSPLSFCAAMLLSLSIIGTESSNHTRVNICVSNHDERLNISLYTSSPVPNESVVHNNSRAVLFDIFPNKTNETTLLFRIADKSRMAVEYATEGDLFYLSLSFKASRLPSSVKAPHFTESEEKILSVLADFLI